MAKIVTLGEIMLRLSSPGQKRFIQSDFFDVDRLINMFAFKNIKTFNELTYKFNYIFSIAKINIKIISFFKNCFCQFCFLRLFR